MLFFFCADQDGDKKLTLSEFISLPVGTVENQQAQDIDDDWVKDRRKEFQEVIDANHDGIVTMEELEVKFLLLFNPVLFKYTIKTPQIFELQHNYLQMFREKNRI